MVILQSIIDIICLFLGLPSGFMPKDIKRPILHYLTAVCLISLCFNFSGASEVDVEDFGAGSGQIWLDQLSCPDGASDLSSCQKNAWGDHDCGHSEDTGIRCIAPNEGGMYPRRI